MQSRFYQQVVWLQNEYITEMANVAKWSEILLGRKIRWNFMQENGGQSRVWIYQ